MPINILERMINLSFAHLLKEQLKGVRVTTHVRRIIRLPICEGKKHRFNRSFDYHVYYANSNDNHYLNDPYDNKYTTIIIHTNPKIAVNIREGQPDASVYGKSLNGILHATHHITFNKLHGRLPTIPSNKLWKWYDIERIRIFNKKETKRQKYQQYYISLFPSDSDLYHTAVLISRLLNTLLNSKSKSMTYYESLVVHLSQKDIEELNAP